MATTFYESMFLLTPELAETAAKKEVELLKQKISTHGGSITFEDFWGKRPLAYPVKKMDAGFYVVLQYEFPADQMREFDEELRLDPKILRHLTIKPPKNVAPMTYAEVKASEAEFVEGKVAGKRRVKRGPRRVETLEKAEKKAEEKAE